MPSLKAMFSQVAPLSLCLHCAVEMPLVCTHGVDALGVGDPAPIVPGKGVVGASGINVPTEPFCWSSVGLTHTTSIPEATVPPNRVLLGRPKNESAGGSFRNEE